MENNFDGEIFLKKKAHRALVGQAADLAAITVDAR
jgi:hypothetical protein